MLECSFHRTGNQQMMLSVKEELVMSIKLLHLNTQGNKIIGKQHFLAHLRYHRWFYSMVICKIGGEGVFLLRGELAVRSCFKVDFSIPIAASPFLQYLEKTDKE